MVFDRPIGLQEAAVSCETAVSCLALLRSQISSDVDTKILRSPEQVHGPTLAISELLELANDFGFEAQYIHRDWPWLQLALTTRPILLLLKNGNMIVAVGVGRTDAEEIVVSDPLHRSGALIILSRGNIERAWDGDAVTVLPKVFLNGRVDSERGIVAAVKSLNGIEKTQKFWKLFSVILLCLGSVALVSVLITLPTAEKPIGNQKTSLIPATPPPHVSAIKNLVGHQHVSDQAVTVEAPTKALAYRTSGSIAAGAISPLNDTSLSLAYTASGLTAAGAIPPLLLAPLPSNPKNPESPVVELLASVPSVAEVNAEPIGVAPIANAEVPLGALVPLVSAQIAANAVMPPPAGSPPASEGSGLSGNVKLPPSDVAALLARGDDQLRLGDVASARLFYQHAADAGEAIATLRLGETYDPIFLNRANLHGVSGDMEKAVFWYYRARDLGSKEADKLLKELTTNNSTTH
jgi:hypothetical protein